MSTDFEIMTDSVWAFQAPLNFPASDIEDHPWLSGGTRYYRIENALDKGGFALPFVAVPCDIHGTPIEGATKVVLKFPNVGPSDRFTSKERADRQHYSEEKAIMEWNHARRRLLGCKHANPIMDFDWLWIHKQRSIVSCQVYLEGYVPLLKWLETHGQVPIINRRNGGITHDWVNWHGLSNSKMWFKITRNLADALASVHRHRVIHGDIWPPNVFVSTDTPATVKFIDFGESAAFFPDGKMEQKNHPFRAPERDREGDYVPTESVDVYSFGKLLLYLSTGLNREIARDRRGHERRQTVRSWLLERNPTLLRENPEVLDIIARCTAYEPVDRPTMQSVREDLMARQQAASPHKSRTDEIKASRERVRARYDALFSGTSRKVMRQLVDQKIREVEALLEDFDSEMIVVEGSRNYLIRALASLFDELDVGDSWSTITTPEVWQAGALGLDGRYRTATIQAIRRGVAISRGYVVSVEELGVEWCKAFIEALGSIPQPADATHALAQAFQNRLSEYRSVAGRSDFIGAKEGQLDSCKRFVGLLASLGDMVSTWELHDYINTGRFDTISGAQGCYLGIIPQARSKDVCAIRRDNPASLMYRSDPDTPPEERWHLVMTDIRGRSDSSERSQRPQLLGFRVYRTVMEKGIPDDRIIYLQRLLNESAINIGTAVAEVSQCAQSALDRVAFAGNAPGL